MLKPIPAIKRLRTITVTYDAGIPKIYRAENFPNLRYAISPRGELMIFRYTRLIEFDPLNRGPEQNHFREDIACFAAGKWVSYDLEYFAEEFEPEPEPQQMQEPVPSYDEPIRANDLVMEQPGGEVTVEIPRVVPAVLAQGTMVRETDLYRQGRGFPVSQEDAELARNLLKERLERQATQQADTVILDPDSTGDPDLDRLVGAPRPSGVMAGPLVTPGAMSYRVKVAPPVRDLQRSPVPMRDGEGDAAPFLLGSRGRNRAERFSAGIDAGRRIGGTHSLRSPLY